MPKFQTPDQIYGELFEAVQTQRAFDDSKTFVDAVPKYDAPYILSKFESVDRRSKADLRRFVRENFSLPDEQQRTTAISEIPPVRDRIETLWSTLSRAADSVEPNSSLIALPNPYIVPGGRFREIYYWDSYFTMLGLAKSGQISAIENMVENFAYLIDEIGFVPNGNRTYFCTRSQPPFFVLMVELLADMQNDRSVMQRYLPRLRCEYEFWMKGAENLSESSRCTGRVLKIGAGYLNRYWDDSDDPRPESYAEDLELAAMSKRNDRELFRDIRAACESGWDFSSRWLERSDSLASIRTSAILPIDLNALLYRTEAVLATTYGEFGDPDSARSFSVRAAARKELLQTLFFDDETGFFVDLLYPELRPTGIPSLAGTFPLFLELASAEQAARAVTRLQNGFLAAGGWLTTLQASGQQWDRPNGWAPLQWIAFKGMCNYGFVDEAELGAKRWVKNNLDVYYETGTLLEKYDVEELGALATGGEYAVQDGFGWTNAILLLLMEHLEST